MKTRQRKCLTTAGVAILVLTFVLVIFTPFDRYQFGYINYSYTLVEYNDTYLMQNSFVCGINGISIICDNDVNSGNLDGHDICDLLGNHENKYRYHRVHINPSYNPLNGVLCLSLICIGCNLTWIVLSFILCKLKLQQKTSIIICSFNMLINILTASTGIYFGFQMVGTTQKCTIGLQPYLESQMGSEWTEQYAWKNYSDMERVSITFGYLIFNAMCIIFVDIIVLMVLIRVPKYTSKNKQLECEGIMEEGLINYNTNMKTTKR